MDTLLQQIINGYVQGSVYAMVALGYTMVYGILRLINFAHGEIVMVGAMSSLIHSTTANQFWLTPTCITVQPDYFSFSVYVFGLQY